jgi:hypothetical protein
VPHRSRCAQSVPRRCGRSRVRESARALPARGSLPFTLQLSTLQLSTLQLSTLQLSTLQLSTLQRDVRQAQLGCLRRVRREPVPAEVEQRRVVTKSGAGVGDDRTGEAADDFLRFPARQMLTREQVAQPVFAEIIIS